MDSLKGGVENVKDEVVKRMRSPFVGAFVIAWCVVNYEFLIVVFSGGEYPEKIGYIARHLFYGSDLLHSFGTPLLLAAGSTVLLPLVNLVTDLWNKFVDILGTQLQLWMETRRRVSDPDLRKLAQTRKFELDSLRRYGRERVIQNGRVVTRLFVLGHVEAWDLRPLSNLSGVSEALTIDLARTLETVGLPAQGYRMLQMLNGEGVLSEERLISSTRGSLPEDPALEILCMLQGVGVVNILWDEGVAPSYEISQSGKGLLNSIEVYYPEMFTPRPQ
jgi:hypothetical protein